MSVKITYTRVDEAPELATFSLLPGIEFFLQGAGISIDAKDISLSSRILANFEEVRDDLSALGKIVEQPDAIVIKLPNISATVSQLTAAITELQDKGHDIPSYPEDPENETEQDIKSRYDKIIGSVVNPVLRRGNSQRIIPQAVKQDAQRSPHQMGEWSADSKTHVAHMKEGDFRSTEKSLVLGGPVSARIEFVTEDGQATVLKDGIDLGQDEILDAAVMSRQALREFLGEQIHDAAKQDLLWSLHLKATMMIKTDGEMFGDAVQVYFSNVFERHGATLESLGVEPKNGFADMRTKIYSLPDSEREEIEAGIRLCLENQADLAYVNPKAGISNLDAPNHVIVDASMPNVVRWSGHMEDAKNTSRDVKCVIPDGSYAPIYQVVIDFCKDNGAFDPATMGSVDNIGLMADKAEEYGSKDKTFYAAGAGKMRVVAGDDVLLEHDVHQDDILRVCQTKDAAVKNWVKLAVSRARLTGNPAIFWLDSGRPHDVLLIEKVERYLQDHDTNGLDIEIMNYVDAMNYTLERVKKGENTVSVTGNVLRDYLTDLFPILEVGSSAKMLSLIPLMNGGLLAETGSGGTAPKHQKQLMDEGHLRWNSLGEALALSEALRHMEGNEKAGILADTLEAATSRWLQEGKAPGRKVGELDTRGSHFYLLRFWAEALAAHDGEAELKERFAGIADALAANEDKIIAELDEGQGQPVDLGGYYRHDPDKTESIMRPSATLNEILR